MGTGPIPSTKALDLAGWNIKMLTYLKSMRLLLHKVDVLKTLSIPEEKGTWGSYSFSAINGASEQEHLHTYSEMIKRDVKKGLATLTGGGMG